MYYYVLSQGHLIGTSVILEEGLILSSMTSLPDFISYDPIFKKGYILRYWSLEPKHILGREGGVGGFSGIGEHSP